MRILFLTGAILALSGTLARAQSLEEVLVTGQRHNPLPEELNEQAVTSLHQALLNIAGSSAHASEDSNMGDNFFIRGFSALNDVFVDGMRDPGHYLRDSFDMESLEVLEGPSGGGFDYVGNRTPSTIFEEFGVMQVVPSYWTLGLMAGYRITDNLRVQVNIDNLTDSKYFDGIDDNHVNPGEGRVAFFTLRYRM